MKHVSKLMDNVNFYKHPILFYCLNEFVRQLLRLLDFPKNGFLLCEFNLIMFLLSVILWTKMLEDYRKFAL